MEIIRSIINQKTLQNYLTLHLKWLKDVIKKVNWNRLILEIMLIVIIMKKILLLEKVNATINN